jgi:putative addiction module component (TIGR02574 family)
MAYNIDELLALPVRERRKISERIISSLPENKTELILTNDEKRLLDERWENHISGKSKSYTSKEMWEKILKRKRKSHIV